MWELDCKESWVPKNWCFWTVALEKTLESPLVCKEIKSVSSKENQPWIFTGLKLKLQYLALWCEELTHWKRPLMLGKIDGRRRREWPRMRLLDRITDSIGMNLSKLQEIVEDRGGWCPVVLGVSKSRTGFSDWITTKTSSYKVFNGGHNEHHPFTYIQQNYDNMTLV